MNLFSRNRGNLMERAMYQHLEDCDGDSTSQEAKFATPVTLYPYCPSSWLLPLNIALFMLSALMLTTSILLVNHRLGFNIFGDCVLREMSPNSPIPRYLHLDLIEKRMNATLLPSIDDEIFRGDPSHEVDLAWQRISNIKPIAISREQVLAIGKDPDHIVKYPLELGLGENKYAARIDVFHQIHCLDTLRREAYFEHYYGENYTDYNSTSKLHKAHLSHCVYILLQNIMCQANLDIYTHIWTDTVVQPYPDFNITHKCRNFDAILNWQEKNSLDLHEFYNMRKPDDFGDAKEMSEDFKELWRGEEIVNGEADHHSGVGTG